MNNFYAKLIVVFALVFLSCECSNTNHPTDRNGSEKDTANLVYSKFDFFSINNRKKAEISLGYLQGLEKSDSAGPYVSRLYYSDTLSFVLFFVPVNSAKDSVTFDDVRKDEMLGYPNFKCVAFVYKMSDPSSAVKYHDDNVEYPIMVKAYEFKRKRWLFISQAIAQSLKGLSTFESYVLTRS